MPVTPELSEVIASAIESRLVDLHTALPCVIDSYDDAAQTVACTPLLSRVLENADGTLATEKLPSLVNVPVAFPRSAAFVFRFPLVAGDTGLVVFSEVPTDQWLGLPFLGRDSQGTPGDVRRHTLSGGLFLPGAYNAARRMPPALSAGMYLGSATGVQAKFPAAGPAEFAIHPAPTDAVALSLAVTANFVRLIAAISAGFGALAAPAGGPAGNLAFTTALAVPPSVPIPVGSSALKAGF